MLFWFILAAVALLTWGGLNAAKDFKRLNEYGYSAILNTLSVGAFAIFLIYLLPLYSWATNL